MKWLVKTCLAVMGIGLIGCAVFGTFLEQSGEYVDWSEYFSWRIPGSYGSVEGPVSELGTEQIGSETGEITGLDFEIGAAKLIIKEGDDFGVEVKGSPVNSYVSDGIWYIASQTRGFSFMVETDTVTVTVPKDAAFETISIEVGAGEAEVCELKTNVAYLTVGVGKCTMDRLDIYGYLDIEVGVGDFEGSCTSPIETRIDCGMGNVELDMEASEQEYQISADCGMGNVKAGSLKVSGSRESSSTLDGAEKRLFIDCGLGNVTVDFLK